ncbi:hypothetical protein FA15DRAFT_704215 [Coprinopsis marcescibilis]|uniref:AIG1-type G domain-containing protein n=1 Tax=Coprinopsis marcescibilis TaxID=230819 RepID=A0A5C3KWT5_COPMA|nr:hypothetical protein FA15DRAFT_704215 [Coprinopsis marcescibilis]
MGNRVQTAPDYLPNDSIVIVLGPTGSGKSTFINNVVGEAVAPTSPGLDSCTTTIRGYRVPFKHDRSLPQRLFLVDTPGFDAILDNIDASRTFKDLCEWLKIAHCQGATVGAMVYIFGCTNRVANSYCEDLKIFQEMCGKDFLPKVVLCVTGGDSDKDATDQRMEALRQSVRWEPLLQAGASMGHLKNSSTSATEVVKKLAGTGAFNRTCTLALMDELADHKSPDQTASGKSLRSWFKESRTYKALKNLRRLFGFHRIGV